MKVVVFGVQYYNYTKSMCYALQKLGHEVLMVENIEKTDQAILRKKNQMRDFRPDLFINFCGNYVKDIIDVEFLQSLVNCKKISLFADAVSFVGEIEQHFELYDKIFVFEPGDVEFLKITYGIDALMNTASVAEEIYCNDYGPVEKIYDISFVGVMTEDRLKFFDAIAEFAYKENLRMICYSHFWHNKHWWQRFFAKRKFAKKHPYLSKYAVNEYIQPKDAALLYNKTKICLNKHIERHKGLNSRAFEIMGNGNFILCDRRVQASDFGLIDGQNIVFYKDLDECKMKIKYYLNHESQREKIAQNGADLVKNKYTTRACWERMLKNIFQ